MYVVCWITLNTMSVCLAFNGQLSVHYRSDFPNMYVCCAGNLPSSGRCGESQCPELWRRKRITSLYSTPSFHCCPCSSFLFLSSHTLYILSLSFCFQIIPLFIGINDKTIGHQLWHKWWQHIGCIIFINDWYNFHCRLLTMTTLFLRVVYSCCWLLLINGINPNNTYRRADVKIMLVLTFIPCLSRNPRRKQRQLPWHIIVKSP